MLKYLALLFNTVAILVYQFFFAEGITVTQNVPSTAKPGGEFTVELTINKGSVGGFAKLQQDLPEGFTAVPDENNGGSFTFSNQSVKLIWMSLPSDKEFKVKYKVKVAEGLSGDKVIGGKFSYVSDNVKQAVDISPATITVGSGSAPVVNTTPNNTLTETLVDKEPVSTTTPTTTATEPIATNTATTTPTPDNTTNTTPANTAATTPVVNEPGSISCVRNIPANPGSEFTVEIVVNKGNVTGFAKLMETLPAGFTATAVESQGGSFTFTPGEQKIKYVWVSMPSQPEFKISYKVKATVTGNQVIDGVFSYIENDETKKFVLPTSTVNIGGGSQPVVTDNTANNTTNVAANTNTTETNTNTAANTTNTTNTAANTTSTEANTANNTANNTTTDNTEKAVSATTIPSPQGNVNYRVQVMALHKAVDANTLAAKYNISQKINTEMAEGFTKYTVGAHTEYKAARDAREEIKNKGVAGPFVTAYNSGKRITVQEALMITNQKWFR
jgi:hypothetical protein